MAVANIGNQKIKISELAALMSEYPRSEDRCQRLENDEKRIKTG